jgi:hypothetical protein
MGQPGPSSALSSPPNFSVNGGLVGAIALTFGPNGNLFVSSNTSNSVLEYNGTTGAFVTAFVPSGSGGLIPRAAEGFQNQPRGLTYDWTKYRGQSSASVGNGERQ